MMKKAAVIFTVIVPLLVMLTGCGSDTFTIEGEAKGMGTQNIRAIFYADGAMQSIPASMVNGKFSIQGRSTEPTIVSIYQSDKSLLGRLVVENGETVKATFQKGDPWPTQLKGDPTSEKLSTFINTNRRILLSGDTKAINALVKSYIKDNPSELASAVILVTIFDSSRDPHGALEALELIEPSARPAHMVDGFAQLTAKVDSSLMRQRMMPIRYYGKGDSLTTLRAAGSPRTLLAFTSSTSGRDSVVKGLRDIAKSTDRRRLRIVELSADPDSMLWRRSLRHDSATWTQGWIPTALMAQGVDRLQVGGMPFFILVDSTGRQSLRTSSISAAKKAVKQPK